MKKLRYKTRVGLLLGTLVIILLLNNIAGQESYARMQKDVTSIYEDRLLPSTFLFRIREHLFEERLLADRAADASPEERYRHRVAIAGLVYRYEQTLLTAPEQKEWNVLKGHLARLDAAFAGTPARQGEFSQTLQVLNNLISIQADEGAHLKKEVSGAIADSSLRSDLEIVLLIVIGCVTLSLIGYSRNVFEKTVSHRPSMN